MTNQTDNTIELLKQALLAAFALIVFYAMTSCNAYAAMYQQPTQGAATETAAPVVIQSPSSTTEATAAPLACTVTTGYDQGALNMRTGPGTQYAIIRVLHEGEALQVIERGAWLKVNAGGLGYVNGKYCK